VVIGTDCKGSCRSKLPYDHDHDGPGGVMVTVLASSVIDRGLKHLSAQTKRQLLFVASLLSMRH
jgi:hypothetical protein